MYVLDISMLCVDAITNNFSYKKSPTRGAYPVWETCFVA